MAKKITLWPGEELLISYGVTPTPTPAPTPTPTPTPTEPTQPAASPVGTVVTTAGQPLYDAAGNAYELIAVPGQIQITPWTATGPGTPFTVTSSADVVSLKAVAPSSTVPTGVTQINGLGATWSVASTNVPGVLVLPAPAAPVAGFPAAPPPTLTFVPGSANPYPDFGTPNFAITDFTKWIANTARQGSATQLATTIPSPGGGLDHEPGNPETEEYLDPNDPTQRNPFSLGPNGELIITAQPAAGDGGNPSGGALTYNSGCICTAGSGGILHAQGYGLITFRTKSAVMDGMWPANWCLPVENNFDYTGEPDLMEWWQGLPQYHEGMAYTTGGAFEPNPVGSYTVADYHNYTLFWTPTWFGFYLDGTLMSSGTTPAGLVDTTLCLISNLAVGTVGSWVDNPGTQTATHTIAGMHTYDMPATFPAKT